MYFYQFLIFIFFHFYIFICLKYYGFLKSKYRKYINYLIYIFILLYKNIAFFLLLYLAIIDIVKAAVRWVRWYGTAGAGTCPLYPPFQFVPYPPIPTHAHPYPPVPHLLYPPYPTKKQVSDVPTHVGSPNFLSFPLKAR